ncbi:NF-kappa-B inhibitor-interacting Ras-like protein 1 isoform X1 [Panthera leo]|uniref:NF-kappa-B inhibitor-interacting Ras-like protein 1 isoform X1 n=1 Tax=Panthera leo TaxID=9689 RepID=UPI001C6A756F|nr:NF-kappa-B inhibitor-interacting Ras-like protein 1 isoform X1 [Panthera leo]XP_042759576.1 NF-kappa-B inhibitor-interacting Ras-like protein 1 isoform X1 [Panthera leo]XP_042759577.1 NF-kappa-B inhibitor-interacting Ras-like protein 1 isoform X1 [Panthera leo]XP_042759578.1 NF-kappa-B inhibitor-interacting Ras-like protein 1 isoform X1 [Panthera leo]XP_042759579.1 NF-kappa-B inhibitor-interacting Ras-like protein 1 isoform X1 [Panthera leo]
MGKGCKVVVCGLLSVGKTAILEQLLYGNHTIVRTLKTAQVDGIKGRKQGGGTGMEDCETMEDVYMASVETDRGVKEQLHLYDTRGLQEGVELPKHYFSFADGFVLVYSVNNLESFQRVELLKKEIDKFKDKKEVAIVVLGNKIDLSEQRQVDAEVAQQWARSEKVRLWEVTEFTIMESQQVRSQNWERITAVDKSTQARGAWIAFFWFPNSKVKIII